MHLEKHNLALSDSSHPSVNDKNKSWVIFLQWLFEGMGEQGDQIDLILLNFTDTGRRVLGKAEIPSITLLLCHGTAAHSFCSEPCAVHNLKCTYSYCLSQDLLRSNLQP